MWDNMKELITAILLTVIVSGGCCASNSESKAVIPREVVLQPGMTVMAENKNGIVKISYVSVLKRKFTWNGKSQVVRMIPRSERWQGMLGLYNPASTWFMSCRKRLVVQEAQLLFNTQEEIKAFLKEGSSYMDWVYTRDGLVVGFGETPARNQVNIDLWQIYLTDRKPNDLSGARPDNIRIICNGNGQP
jgi:hypothetical protein